MKLGLVHAVSDDACLVSRLRGTEEAADQNASMRKSDKEEAPSSNHAHARMTMRQHG